MFIFANRLAACVQPQLPVPEAGLNTFRVRVKAGDRPLHDPFMNNSSVRGPDIYLSRQDVLFTFIPPVNFTWWSGDYTNRQPAPVAAFGPGEFIFNPGDVPGIGGSSWSIDSAPPMPPP